MKILLISLVSIFAILITSELVMTYPGGISGRTKKTSTQGCGSCHSLNAAITGSITGPDSVFYGQTVNYTVTITRSGSSARGGVDIATRHGVLAPGPGSSYLKLSGGELIQLPSNGLVLTNGTFSCQFSYTAPSSTVIDTIWLTEAIGHSNGWNWGTEKSIRVVNPLGINNNNTPLQFLLNQNYPNPFNPLTNIEYMIAHTGIVSIKIYDVKGNEIETLINNELRPGNYKTEWNAEGYASGIYYCIMNSSGYTETRKMVLVK